MQHHITTTSRAVAALSLTVLLPACGLGPELTPWSKRTMILLYMRTLEGHLRMKLGRGLHTGFGLGLTTSLEAGPAPAASIRGRAWRTSRRS